MEVDLVSGSEFIRASKVQNLARSTSFREVTSIFEEGIPGFGQLTIEKERGLAGKVVRALLAGPIECDLTGRRPIIGELVGPGQLEAGVVAVTGDRFSSAGKAQEKNAREIEVPSGWTELLFNPDCDVAKAGGLRACRG